jgi:uncharacterized protein involved in type VI secretion and phage assembly
MRAVQTLILGVGIGVGLTIGFAVLPVLRSADAEVSDKRLDKRIVKLLKKARKRGTVEGGIAVGVVTGSRDPEGKFRVRVRFSWQEPTESEGVWAARAIPPGSDPSEFLPEVDDEVLVAFVHGDIRAPVILGSLWSGEDR